MATYIQTGNVLFSHPAARAWPPWLPDIERQLERDFGSSPAVILRTVADLSRTVATSPFAQAGGRSLAAIT